MKKKFILAANGSYGNRGCEAITRGTMLILEKTFKEVEAVSMSLFDSKEDSERQIALEIDDRIKYEEVITTKEKYDRIWYINNILRRISPSLAGDLMWKNIYKHINDSMAVLSVGGDNYSLDYRDEISTLVNLDNISIKRKKPIILWGASVGPFSRIPSYEKFLIKHLSNTFIFARESSTLNYLEDIGIKDNVFKVSDPAFIMPAKKPKDGIEILTDSIGINLSPLMAKFVTGGDTEKWKKLAQDIIETLAKETQKTIYLIPHVTGKIGNDDYVFLKNIHENIKNKDQVRIIDNKYNAEELKWIISNLSVFAGSRMHSTIASLSMTIPTLTLSYSMKSQGINEDIFGHQQHCLTNKDINKDIVIEKLLCLYESKTNIKEFLTKKMPEVKSLSYKAGDFLKELI